MHWQEEVTKVKDYYLQTLNHQINKSSNHKIIFISLRSSQKVMQKNRGILHRCLAFLHHLLHSTK